MNPYQNMIINDINKININVDTSQMEQWSTLSNVINYVQYRKNPVDYFKLDVKASEPKIHQKIYKKLEEDDRLVIYLDFGDTLEKMKEEYSVAD